MDRKIRVGAVSYLNTKPLVYAFEQGAMKDEIDLVFDYPAQIAKMLLQDSIDVGLVPVAVIPQLKTAEIISKYCIGSTGPVASVCLFCEVPVESIEEILLDYQSRTSAALLKILLKEYWKINPLLTDTRVGYRGDIRGTTAGLVIGDRALQQRQKSAYIYDLAEAWQQLTGLPFVFAAWVANKKLPGEFISAFDDATGEGLNHIDQIAQASNVSYYDLGIYYKQNINYLFDQEKEKALQLFLEKLG